MRDHREILTKVLQILDEVCPDRSANAARSAQASLIDDYYVDSSSTAPNWCSRRALGAV